MRPIPTLGLLATALLAAPALGMEATAFDSGNLAPGASFAWKAVEGSYAYQCRLHPSMTGSITVTTGDGMGQEQAVDIRGFQFAPANVTLPAGAMVRWTNRDQAPHTAMGHAAANMEGMAKNDSMTKDNGTMMDKGGGAMGDGMMDERGAAARTPGPGALLAALALLGAAGAARRARP